MPLGGGHYARAVADPPVTSPLPTRVALRRTLTLRSSALRRVARDAELGWFLGLIAMSGLILGLSIAFPRNWPLGAYVVPLLLAMNVLSARRVMLLEVVVAACLIVSLTKIHLLGIRWLGAIVLVVVGIIVLWQAVDRSRLGVASGRGESMLVDLRDRLAFQGQLPALPRNWHAEAVMRSAGGASFAGDFIVAAKTDNGRRLEVVVVDVSGKGIDAGTRSLLLSGAFGGLLGALPRQEFLPAANQYLLRQEWREGFATAVHLAVDLGSGEFEVRAAGHPPAVQFHAGSGRWSVYWTEGPVLGVVDAATYSVQRGQLLVGDVLLLYTDGVVETAQRDIRFGIDKLVGEAERLVRRGWDGAAERLVTSMRSESDDRAIFLLNRR